MWRQKPDVRAANINNNSEWSYLNVHCSYFVQRYSALSRFSTQVESKSSQHSSCAFFRYRGVAAARRICVEKSFVFFSLSVGRQRWPASLGSRKTLGSWSLCFRVIIVFSRSSRRHSTSSLAASSAKTARKRRSSTPTSPYVICISWMLFPVWSRRPFSAIMRFLPSGPTHGRFELWSPSWRIYGLAWKRKQP